MKPELHIFTNAIPSAPSTYVIEQTYASFAEAFGKPDTLRIWYDPKPNINAAGKYKSRLIKLFGEVITETKSLSDGYINAIKQSSADYLFMLEHDWVFIDGITHSLDEIIQTMSENDVWHMRFNKRQNDPVGCDLWIKERQWSVPMCLTPCLSNNPHIICRKLYIQHALPMIKVAARSKGIEHKISNKGLVGAIYGPERHPKTVQHLDGRERKNKK